MATEAEERRRGQYPDRAALLSLAQEFFSTHQKRLLPCAHEQLDEALNGRSVSPDTLFSEWFALYRIDRWSEPRVALLRLQNAVPQAPSVDVWEVAIQAQIRGLSEQDAKRSLERRMRQRQQTPPRFTSGDTASLALQEREESAATELTPQVDRKMVFATTVGSASSSPPPVTRSSPLPRSSPTIYTAQHRTDPIAEEMKDWLVNLLRPTANDTKEASHPSGTAMTLLRERWAALSATDASELPAALSDGVLLVVAAQRMQDPEKSYQSLMMPKRCDGFYARDNLAKFLQQVQTIFPLLSSVCTLLEPGDFVDPTDKSRRAVVTFLLNLARAAVKSGTAYRGPVPDLLRQEAALDEAPPISDAEVTEAMAASPLPPAAVSTATPKIALSNRPTPEWNHQGTALHEPQKPDSVVSQNEVRHAVVLLAANTDPNSADGAAAPLKYVSIPDDPIDVAVGAAVNRVLYSAPQPRGGAVTHLSAAAELRSNLRLQRLQRKGAYVLYNTTTKKKLVVHARIVRDVAVVRVGGGWDDFEEWLKRHESLRLS